MFFSGGVGMDIKKCLSWVKNTRKKKVVVVLSGKKLLVFLKTTQTKHVSAPCLVSFPPLTRKKKGIYLNFYVKGKHTHTHARGLMSTAHVGKRTLFWGLYFVMGVPQWEFTFFVSLCDITFFVNTATRANILDTPARIFTPPPIGIMKTKNK